MGIIMNVGRVIELNSILDRMAKLPKNPLKFCTIRNAKEISVVIEDFESNRAELFNDSVMLGVGGDPIILEDKRESVKKIKGLGAGIPWDFYQYKDEASKSKFFNDVKNLLSEELTLNLKSESLSRSIFVSLPDGSQVESTIEGVLEDPSNDVDVNILSILMDCGILVD